MTDSVITWGAFIGAAGAILALIKFWMMVTEKIGAARGKAEMAKADADEAKQLAKSATDSVGVLTSAFSIHREMIAREYIHRDSLREMEARVMGGIEKLGDRIDRIFENAKITER